MPFHGNSLYFGHKTFRTPKILHIMQAIGKTGIGRLRTGRFEIGFEVKRTTLLAANQIGAEKHSSHTVQARLTQENRSRALADGASSRIDERHGDTAGQTPRSPTSFHRPDLATAEGSHRKFSSTGSLTRGAFAIDPPMPAVRAPR